MEDSRKIKGRENLSQILGSLLLQRVLKLICFDFLKGFAEQANLYLCKKVQMRGRQDGYNFRNTCSNYIKALQMEKKKIVMKAGKMLEI